MPCEIAAALLRTLSEKSALWAGNLSPPIGVLIGLEFPGGRIPDWALVNWSRLMASSSLYLDISLSSRGRLFFSLSPNSIDTIAVRRRVWAMKDRKRGQSLCSNCKEWVYPHVSKTKPTGYVKIDVEGPFDPVFGVGGGRKKHYCPKCNKPLSPPHYFDEDEAETHRKIESESQSTVGWLFLGMIAFFAIPVGLVLLYEEYNPEDPSESYDPYDFLDDDDFKERIGEITPPANYAYDDFNVGDRVRFRLKSSDFYGLEGVVLEKEGFGDLKVEFSVAFRPFVQSFDCKEFDIIGGDK
jgi:hypothetical protein